MKIKFVTEEQVNQVGRGRPNSRLSQLMSDFAEELYKHPSQWAEFPEQIPNSTFISRMRTKYANLEFRATGGNNHPIDHPDKLHYTVYVRYVPENPGNDELI